MKGRAEPEKVAFGAWKRLAAELEVSHNTLITWRKKTDAPQTTDVEQWRAYVIANGLGLGGNHKGREREALLAASVEKRNRLLDLEIAREERKSVDRAEAEALFLHVASLQKTVLYAALERELPAKAEGRSASEIAVLGREMADRLCEIFAGPIDSWRSV